METRNGFNRRQAIGLSAGAIAGAALLPGVANAQEGEGKRLRAAENLVPQANIGIQMFTIRDMQAADFAGTARLLADIGYRKIELFTLQGLAAPALRDLLENVGIRAVAAHVGVDRWRGELETVLDEAVTLGMPYVGLPGIFPNPPATAAVYTALAHEMNGWGQAAADRGLKFYYHNHNFEFTREGGTRLYDVLLNNTDPDTVFFEMDLYWVVTGGVDPLDYLQRYDQSRWPLFHVKDRNAAGEFADLGEGNINFGRIFRALENKQYHHYFVERDTQVNPPQTAATGYTYLRSLRGRRRRKPYSPSEAGGGNQ